MSDAFRQIGRGTINLKGSSIIKFLVKSCQRRSCEQVRKPFYIWSIIGKDLNGFSVVFVMISVCRKSESIRPSDSPSMTIETVSSPPISLVLISYPCHWCLAEKAYLLLWGMCGIGPENVKYWTWKYVWYWTWKCGVLDLKMCLILDLEIAFLLN